MTLRKMAIIAALPLLIACSGKKAEEKSSPLTPREQLLALLDSASTSKTVFFGHHDDTVYGHSWELEEGRSDILEIVGDYPAVMSWDLGGIEADDSLNLDGVPFERISREVVAQDERGGINTFSWHLHNPVNGGDAWDVSDTTIVAQIAHNPETTERFREQVRKAARFFNSLTDSSGDKVGVIFRPWHEHNGNWFWWGQDFASDEDFRFLWTEMRRVMDEEGADNVVYAYSPDRVDSEKEYLHRYPGDKYVDILGIDIYHLGGEAGVEDYREAANRGLGIVEKLAMEKGKRAAFTETGLESINMRGWYTQVLLPLMQRHHSLGYVVVWRNAPDKPAHFYAPYPGHIEAADFLNFKHNATTGFASDAHGFAPKYRKAART